MVVVAVPLILILLFLMLRVESPGYSVPLNDLSSHLTSGKLKSVRVSPDSIDGEFISPQQRGGRSVLYFRADLPQGLGNDWTFIQWVISNSRGAEVTASRSSLWTNILLPLIPWFLIFFFIWFFVFKQLRGRKNEPLRVIVVNEPVSAPPLPPSVPKE